jgi:GNAT superfamily N-acetyltransferase
MTDVQRRPTSSTIRAYRPTDHSACRGLWGELIAHRSRLTDTPPPDDDADLGAGFEEYLTRLNLSGLWVAADRESDEVVGFVGLVLDGNAGEVDPVIVTSSHRGRGVGRALLARVADEGQRRGLRRLTISPPVRDVAALRSLHSAGFATLANVTLTLDQPGAAPASGSLELFDLTFRT